MENVLPGWEILHGRKMSGSDGKRPARLKNAHTLCISGKYPHTLHGRKVTAHLHERKRPHAQNICESVIRAP